MPTVKRTLDLADPPKLSPETEARMAMMTAAEIEANAASDSDNPPLSQAELVRMNKARFVRAARRETGLVQEVFARAFLISPGRLRDLEQGRTEPDDAFLAYMALIRLDPNMVRSTIGGSFSQDGQLRNLEPAEPAIARVKG